MGLNDPTTAATPRALIVDWGGVLTSALDESMAAFVNADGFTPDEFSRAMAELVGGSAGVEATVNPVHALERGELAVPDFEERLAERLTVISGRPVVARGLIARMFAYFRSAPDMLEVVRRAHTAGLRTGLLSNSWGNEYPVEEWDGAFDAVVISGEVGMRKPEPQIFRHILDLLDCRPHEAVFVDDLAANVRGAVDVGMIGVHHVSHALTVAELEAIFGMVFQG